ncbi:hypothetical protein NECAME_07415 [Necator americanus]|uniref:Uncharacterized protein n=1 Tax=Necator americanus TaxID=51031 RepID=W2TNV1_NECAM|nr:hypothetical protein NECAME_07415 [Necator americanus]ETN83354.1 hypothetical protein NECAME_07415 [Necator americanus]
MGCSVDLHQKCRKKTRLLAMNDHLIKNLMVGAFQRVRITIRLRSVHALSIRRLLMNQSGVHYQT